MFGLRIVPKGGEAYLESVGDVVSDDVSSLLSRGQPRDVRLIGAHGLDSEVTDGAGRAYKVDFFRD